MSPSPKEKAIKKMGIFGTFTGPIHDGCGQLAPNSKMPCVAHGTLRHSLEEVHVQERGYHWSIARYPIDSSGWKYEYDDVNGVFNRHENTFIDFE